MMRWNSLTLTVLLTHLCLAGATVLQLRNSRAEPKRTR